PRLVCRIILLPLLDERVHPATSGSDRYSHTAPFAVRQSVAFEFLPGRTCIRRPKDSAMTAINGRIRTPSRPVRLPRCCKQNLRVPGCDCQIAHANFGALIQDVQPRLSTIG